MDVKTMVFLLIIGMAIGIILGSGGNDRWV